MTACQMITGRGGWPLTVLLTPDGAPFLADTYLPPRSGFGRTGLLDLARAVGEHWAGDRARFEENASQMRRHLSGFYAAMAKGGPALGPEVAEDAEKELAGQFDARFGGFGKAPKFPTPHNLSFLLSRHAAGAGEDTLDMVRRTLSRMRLGGLFDQVGFGYHRYSTDERWLVPHFEKMLYDQAGMAEACLDALYATRLAFFANMAEEIFAYVLRDLAHPEGAFYAGEDADSEGEEGRFYVWTAQQFLDALGVDEGGPLSTLLGVQTAGNYRDESTGELTGANILHLRNFLPQKDALRWEKARRRLLAAREKRVRPHRDEKVLADWNGVMIAALARGGAALQKPEYARAAKNAADFVLKRMRDAEGNLRHRWADGEAAVAGTADDYAWMIHGCIELFRATTEARWLDTAQDMQARLDAHCADAQGGGYFLAPADALLPVRPKELHDGPSPSANSQTLHNLLDLAELAGDAAYLDAARALADAFADNVRAQPTAYTHFLAGATRLAGIEEKMRGGA